MLAQLRLLFGNPKFLTMLIGLILAIGAKYGLQLDNQIVALIVGLVAVTIGAQAHVMAAQAGASSPPLQAPGIVTVPPDSIPSPAVQREKVAALVDSVLSSSSSPPAAPAP